MSKTGRNDPCPCGSGKKYKKCCLAKDQEQQRTPPVAPAVAPTRKRAVDPSADLFEDLPSWVIDDDGLDDNGWVSESDDSPSDVETYQSKPISDYGPEISEQDQALIDSWWTTYEKLTTPDQILQHLNTFFQAHPQLVENLYLHQECLFELGADLVRAGRSGEYIEFLQHLRDAFPSAYLKSFSYYDSDIVCYKIIHQGEDELQTYLNWFKEYPDVDPDSLYELIDFMIVSDYDDLAADLIEAVYDPLLRSPSVLRGGHLVNHLVLHYCAPYLDRGWSQPELAALTEQLKGIHASLRADWYQPDQLDRILSNIAGELDPEFFASYADQRDLDHFYYRTTQNFMGWLRKTQGYSWMKAQFYSSKALEYLLRIIPAGKRPKRPFTITRQLVEQTVGIQYDMFLFPGAVETFSRLNGIYWLSAYLQQHAMLPEQEMREIQAWCTELWSIAEPKLRGGSIESEAFRRFPG